MWLASPVLSNPISLACGLSLLSVSKGAVYLCGDEQLHWEWGWDRKPASAGDISLWVQMLWFANVLRSLHLPRLGRRHGPSRAAPVQPAPQRGIVSD